MSLFVKGAKMPKECMTCPACQGEECWFEDDRPQIPDVLNRRRKRCRLVEVKSPHGRLIDADELMKVIEENDYMLRGSFNTTDRGMFTIGIKQAIEEAPTIIEAED